MKIENIHSKRFKILKNVAFDNYSHRHDYPSMYFNQDDLKWLIEQAEKAEQYEEALKTIIKLTSCYDTWDYANRTLQGNENAQ